MNIFKRQEKSDEQLNGSKTLCVGSFPTCERDTVARSMEEELRLVKEVVQYNPDLKAILKSPKLSIEKKKEILRLLSHQLMYMY